MAAQEMVVVASAMDNMALKLMKTYLEEHGIDALAPEAPVEPVISGERHLEVRAEDEEKARELLRVYATRLDKPLGSVFPWNQTVKP